MTISFLCIAVFLQHPKQNTFPNKYRVVRPGVDYEAVAAVQPLLLKRGSTDFCEDQVARVHANLVEQPPVGVFDYDVIWYWRFYITKAPANRLFVLFFIFSTMVLFILFLIVFNGLD